MTLLTSAPGWLTAILFLLLLVASTQDIWRLEISNWLCVAVALCAFLAIAIGGPIIGLWQNLLLFAAVLGLGTLLFARGWMGGGDVKLLAASALWFDLDQGWKMLVAVAILGGLETLIVMLLRLLPWPAGIRQRIASLRSDEGIPYGVAIATGAIFIALRNP
jgi:prepilin peptidase CpaA